MEFKEGKEHVLPLNKLTKGEKRLDAINQRKQIIAKIYKRGSKKERQRQKERKAEEFISKQGPNQKRRQRPLPTTAEPRMGEISIYQRIQSDDTEREAEAESKGISEKYLKTQKQTKKADRVDVVQENKSPKILSRPNISRNLTLQKSLLETTTDGGNMDESDLRSPDEHILQTMNSGREAIWKKLLERRPFQADVEMKKAQGYAREILGETTSGSTSQTLLEYDEVIKPTNQNVISDPDQELSESVTWEQSVLKGGWPKKSKNEIHRSEDRQEEEKVDNEGALGLRLTTSAPLLIEDELLIKVMLRFV